MPEYFPTPRCNTLLESQQSNRYTWLSELVQGSVGDEDGVGLRQIVIEERIKHPRGFRYGRLVWEPPSTMKNVCVNAGLDLSVWLRKPEDLEDEFKR